MSFTDCIISARDQGALTPEEADDIMRRFDVHYEALKATDHPGGPAGAAKEALLKEIEEAATRKEWLAELAARKTDALAAHFETYRNAKGKPDVVEAALGVLDNRNNTLAGVPSVTGRRDALLGLSHGRIEEMLYNFRRRFGLGKRRDKATLDHMVDEAFGKATGDSAAKDFLEAWRGAADDLLKRFNAAGGDVRMMVDEGSGKSTYFPQNHDARLIASAGEQKWVTFITPKLDVRRMRDPLTYQALEPERLDEILRYIYRNIVTDGAISREPALAVQGRGALANRRADHRFLLFKDGDAWREYNQAFGRSDAFTAMMQHIEGLSKDVAALEVLGPNPNATVEWMKQVAGQEAAKAHLGEPSLYEGKTRSTSGGRLESGDYKIERLWRVINGGSGTGNMAAADVMQATRNFLTGVQLASTTITAVVGDPFQQANARRFAGIDQMRWFADMPRQMFSTASKREVIRAGVIFQDAMDHLAHDIRGQSWHVMGAEASKYLPDRVLTWNGLTPWTRAGRRGAAMTFMFEASERAEQSLAAIGKDGVQGERFARWLQGFGIDAETWDLIRAAKPLEQGEAGSLLRMVDVVNSAPGDERVFDAALRYSEAVHAFQEEAVPEGTAKVRAMMARDTRTGTFWGEATRSAGMYTGFGVNVWTSLMSAMAHETLAGRRGWAYTMGAIATLTIGGAILTQARQIARGNDPQPVNDTDFWIEAMVRGGGLGIWGDYLASDFKKGNGYEQAARVAGPVAAAVFDLVTIIDPRKALTGEWDQTNRGKQAARFAQKYVPVQNMWWLKGVTQRLLWDHLQQIADPEAYRSWMRRERKLMQEHGQGVWWGPGDVAPRRAPDFGTMIER